MLNFVTFTGQHLNINIKICILSGSIVTALRYNWNIVLNTFFFQAHWKNRVCKQPDPCIHSKENTAKVLLHVYTDNISDALEIICDTIMH